MPLNRRIGERAEEDDVEGHAMRSRVGAIDDETGAGPDDGLKHGVAGEDDVEGHAMRSKIGATGDEDDVEGHSNKLR